MRFACFAVATAGAVMAGALLLSGDSGPAKVYLFVGFFLAVFAAALTIPRVHPAVIKALIAPVAATGLLAAVVAVVANSDGKSSDEKTASTAGVTPTASSIVSTPSTGPPSPPSHKTSSPPPTRFTKSPTPAPAVRHTGRLMVYPSPETSKAADLDAPQADPDWSRSGRDLGDGDHEGPYLHGTVVGLYTPNGKTGIALLAEPAGDDYSSCAQANLTTDPIPVGELPKGAIVCVRTSAGRLGVVKLLEEANPERLDLEVTIWD